MKMNILLCLVSTIVLGCSGYKKTEFETWVEKTFSSQCGDSNSCSLNVKNFKPFNWDKMYVFNSSTDMGEVNEVLGFDYPFYTEPCERIVFVKNSKVVYHDEYCQTFDDDVYKSIVFDLENNNTNNVFYADSATFKVKRLKDYRNQIYYLFSK